MLYRLPDRGHGARLMDILHGPNGSITFQTTVSVTVPAGTSMLEAEELLMAKVNQVGTTLTGLLLNTRDTKASSLLRDGRRFTAKQKKKSAMWKRPTAARWFGAALSNPALAAGAFIPWTRRRV